MVEKTVSRIGKVIFGLAGLAASPGKSAFALVEVGAALWDGAEAAGKRPEALLARIIAEQRAAVGREFAGTGAQAELDAVEAALAEAGRVVFERGLLVRSAFTPEGLYAAAAGALLKKLGLTDGARFSAPAVAYARAILVQGLRAAIEAGGLHDRIKAALDIEAARRLGSIDEAVRSEVPRELLESLVQRYGHKNPDAPVADLGAFLKAKAEEWKALKARLAALEVADARLGNAVAAAEAALARAAFDEAEAVLAEAEELQQAERTLVEVSKQADLRLVRAGTALLKGDVDAAAAHFETAAAFFAPFDPVEGARVRQDAAVVLSKYAARFGGSGLARAVELYRRSVEVLTRNAFPEEWATIQTNLGAALAQLAERSEGAEGARLLEEATAAYARGLEVRTPEGTPDDWAASKVNLGLLLTDRAARAGAATARGLLARATAAVRAALTVRKREADPATWASTQDSLGTALVEQAQMEAADEAAALLAEAVAAFHSALAVRTRAADPAGYAHTQNNLAIALSHQADRVGGAAGAALLGKAAAAYREALEVFTRADYPLAWAAAQNNLATALADQAERLPDSQAAALLGQAAAAHRKALAVWTRAEHPADSALAEKNLGFVQEALGDRAGEGAADAYAAAIARFDAALEVFDAEHFGHERAICHEARARVAAKLAALARLS